MMSAAAAMTAVASDVPDPLAETPRYRGWDVVSFDVRGLEPTLADDLRIGLALNGRRTLFRTRRPPLFRRTLADDLQRARAFTARMGYPWARFRVVFVPDRKGGKVGVILEVAPGPAVVVEAVSVSGVPDHLVSDTVANGAPLAVGRRFTEPDLEEVLASLQASLAEGGYPKAVVTPNVTMRDSAHTSVAIEVRSGPRCVFGEIRQNGAPDDLVPLVMKNVGWASGRRYSPTTLREARRNLRELDLFRRIDVFVGEPGDGAVPLVVELVPRKPRTAEIDLGYWTDDFLRVGARWRHRNLLGGGRGTELKGTLSRFRRDSALSVWWPSLFGPRTRLTSRLYYAQEREEGYDLDNAQAELWGSKLMGRSGRLQAGVTVADVNLTVRTSDPLSFQAQSGLLTSLHLRANLDDVDDPINPTSGTSWSGGVEWSPPWFPSDNSFALGTLKVVGYRGFGPSVLASRFEVGVAGPLGDSLDLLPNKRFFAGGSSTMRGTRRRMLGALDRDGSPVGGEAMLLLSTEWRQPLKGRIGGVIFVDAGNVWRLTAVASWQDLKYAVGPGLMVATPVGPVRADAGFALGARPRGEPGFVLHVSVGHPF